MSPADSHMALYYNLPIFQDVYKLILLLVLQKLFL